MTSTRCRAFQSQFTFHKYHPQSTIVTLRKMFITFAIATLITATFAAPTSPPASCRSVEQNASFDDIPGSSVVADNPPPQGYQGLYFQGFTVSTVIRTTDITPGVYPHSGNSYGDITAVTQTLTGTAMLTTNYPKSNTSSFSLESFYFGNLLSLENGASAAPAAANVQITGYQGLDNQVSSAKQVCSRQFQYK